MLVFRVIAAAAAIAAVALPCAMPAQQALAGPPIHQEVDFSVLPQRVYSALTTAQQFQAASGLPARMIPGPGGPFTLFGGQIVGLTIELVPGRRIVQAWRAADWPAGIYSVVRFELQVRGTGTHLVFDQTGFPESDRASLISGWDSHYWSPLKKYLH